MVLGRGYVVNVEGGATPEAGGVPFPSHWVWNCVAACEWVAPGNGGWKAGWEGGCCWVAGWLGACYTKGIAEAGLYEE